MKSNCDYCLYYEYDEDYDCMECSMELDEDEMEHYLRGEYRECPYFIMGDEYRIVRKQV